MADADWVEVVFVPKGAPAFCRRMPFLADRKVTEWLETSGLLRFHPEAVGLPLGVFSKPVALDSLLRPGDRVEVYRPLERHPMEKRRQLAKQASLRRRKMPRELD